MISAFSGIFLPLLLGMICRKTGYIDYRNRPVIQQFAVRTAIPFMAFSSIKNMDIDSADQFIPLSLGIILFMGLAWLFFLGLLRLFRKNEWVNRYRFELILMFYCGNIGHICWQLQQVLIGPEGLQRGLIYTSFYWPGIMIFGLITVKIFGLKKEHDFDKKGMAFSIFPVLTMIVLGLVLNLTGIDLPEWLERFTSTFGSMGIPIILFSMGLSISLREAFQSALSFIPYLLIRTVIWLGIGLFMTSLPFYDGQSRQVLIINALAPLGVASLVLMDTFNLDTKFAAHAITVSTVFFLVFLPFMIYFWPY